MAASDSKELRFYNETKGNELEFYKTLYRNTLKEWKKFTGGSGTVNRSIIPPEILNAWHRCKALGIDPMTIPEKKILTGRAFDLLLDRNREFIDVSRPFLHNLYTFLKGSGFNIALFDRDAYILDVVGDHDLADLMKRTGGVRGALWNEASAGHNVAGGIIVEKKPLQIFGSQNYIKPYHGETSSGAPIFSSDGELLGGISLTARNPRFNAHTLGLAVAAAYAVENDIRTRKAFAERKKAYHLQNTIIASIPEAMFSIDAKGLVSLINEPAVSLFSRPGTQHVGRPLQSLLSPKNNALLSLIQKTDSITDIEVRIFSKNTWQDYTLTMTPISADGGKSMGKMIVLNEIKRAKTMVTTLLGARAVYRFEDICGKNTRFQITLEQAKMMAANDSNVLLYGKSGTGKDMVAQAIHNASLRKNGPYVAINCGSIPRDLLSVELFGHGEESFKDSRCGGHQGKFELAEGGTIFLDEIGELPLELQSQLLRVIEAKTVTRIGGKEPRTINVRIITSTGRDLRTDIKNKTFREDLFYRINVFNIDMIPLYERPDDIPLLTHFFIKKFEDTLKKPIRHIDQQIMDVFSNYHWPGNVRELQNVIEQMMSFAKKGELTRNLIPKEITSNPQNPATIESLEAPEAIEKRMIKKMIDLNFQKTEIAERLNISRATLYRKIKKYRL